MTLAIKTCYSNFVARLMRSTGLPISQMLPLTEWVENRKAQFRLEADEKEKKDGFEFWLTKKYNN